MCTMITVGPECKATSPIASDQLTAGVVFDFVYVHALVNNEARQSRR